MRAWPARFVARYWWRRDSCTQTASSVGRICWKSMLECEDLLYGIWKCECRCQCGLGLNEPVLAVGPGLVSCMEVFGVIAIESALTSAQHWSQQDTSQNTADDICTEGSQHSEYDTHFRNDT